MSRTIQDELLKDFSTAGLPASDDPNINHTTGARVPRAIGLPSELPSLFAGEHTAGESNLPMQVSQREILRQNESRGDNMWTAGGAAPVSDTAAETEYGNLSEKMDEEVSKEETPLKLAKVAIFGDF